MNLNSPFSLVLQALNSHLQDSSSSVQFLMILTTKKKSAFLLDEQTYRKN